MNFRTKLKMCKCSIACYWYINKAGTPVNLYHYNVISTGCSVSMSNETHKHIFLYHYNVISTGCSVSMSNGTHKHIFLS